MTDQRFLVTGAMGCIGAWVVRNLIQEGISTTVYDKAADPHRLRLIMSEDELVRVQFITGDVTDLAAVEAAFKSTGATHVIHLAGLQVPFCRADPSLGAAVNVVGTVNIFEAAKRSGLNRVVYASSVAVYGLNDEYAEGPVPHDAPLHPRNLYGVYKQANEGTARIYWMENQISSIGLRPYTVYGPGRDQGMTSTPTKAMLAAAAGKAYRITFGGRSAFQYADDTAKAFIQSARAAFEGADVYNLRGNIATMPEIIAAIEAAVPSARGQIDFDPTPLQLPEEFDDSALTRVLGKLPEISLTEGVAQTIRIFRQALADGRLAADKV